MAKCFCVGSVLHFVIATVLLTGLLVNVFQVVGNVRKCHRELDEDKISVHDDRIRLVNMARRTKLAHMLELRNMKPGGMNEEKMKERMDRLGLARRRLEEETVATESKDHKELEETRKKCEIADYDSHRKPELLSQWVSVGFSILIIFIVGILGSGIHCSSIGHRKLGLKIATIVLFILQLLFLIPIALYSLFMNLNLMALHEDNNSHYLKGRLVNGFIITGGLFLSWLVNLIHSFVACCCTPAEDEETIKIVRMNKNISDDRLKLVDNVVFGERVFDNDGEIA